jgi:hypothetical protein
MKQTIHTAAKRRSFLKSIAGLCIAHARLPAAYRLEHQDDENVQFLPLPLFSETVQREVAPSVEHESHHFVLVGDTQRTSWLERWLLRREQNDHERLLVLNAIARELADRAPSDPQKHPPTLVLLGDHVCYGEDSEDWQYFDNIFAPVRREIERLSIPVMALAGNHDYGFVQRSRHWLGAMARRFTPMRCGTDGLPRFPALATFGSTAILALDSNVDILSARAVDHQYRQYCRALEYLDTAPNIGVVLVAAHHPPVTNSNLAPDPALMHLVAEPFLAAAKTRLLFAGHVHSYERFEYTTSSGRKFFITAGGGGGPRRPVRIDAGRPHTNDCYRSGTVRPFHYVHLTVNTSSLRGEVMMLRPNGTFGVGDTFELVWQG